VSVSTSRWVLLGFVLTVFLVLQFATGFLMLFYYVPHPELAFESVQRLMNEIPYGWLVRLVHVHGASAILILVIAHMLYAVAKGSYKRPGELSWVTGCLTFLVILGQCQTGTALSWSQLSYWATTITMGIAGRTPLVGSELQQFLQGGEVIGAATLGRFFAVHTTLLPTILVSLILLHLYILGYAQSHHDATREPEAASGPPASRALFPTLTLQAVSAALFALAVFAAVIFLAPHLYSPPESFAKADPFVTPLHVKPEWYFLSLYATFWAIPSHELAMLAQGAAVSGMILLPFLDRSERRPISSRPVFLAGLCVVIACVVGLGVAGALF
jgi:ubiquinol-cytochrome c reductase cytochrome b subunit